MNDFNYAVNDTNGSIQQNLFLQNALGTDSIAQSDSLLIDGVMKGSFEKGSMINSSKAQSLVGSLVIQEGDINADDVMMQLRSGQPPHEEYSDGGTP